MYCSVSFSKPKQVNSTRRTKSQVHSCYHVKPCQAIGMTDRTATHTNKVLRVYRTYFSVFVNNVMLQPLYIWHWRGQGIGT